MADLDAVVPSYWEKHYDIAHLLRTNWKKLGPLLNGKIHLTVGTADTNQANICSISPSAAWILAMWNAAP
jgi:hypothetical protein